jgi:oligopeptidase B
MRARIKEDDSTVPQKDGNWWYYTRFRTGDQYPLHCRKKNINNKPSEIEEIYLDVNILADGKDFLEIGTCEISPNHNIMAYSQDVDGSERFDLSFRDLTTGKEFNEVIPNTHYSVEWANDNKTLYYTVQDENLRPTMVYRHTLGTDYKNDELIYEEKDSRFFIGLAKSSSERFIYIAVDGNNMSEQYFIDANNPKGKPKLIQKRRKNIEYDVDDHEDYFYILHNDNAKDFCISRSLIETPSAEYWKDYISNPELPHYELVKQILGEDAFEKQPLHKILNVLKDKFGFLFYTFPILLRVKRG